MNEDECEWTPEIRGWIQIWLEISHHKFRLTSFPHYFSKNLGNLSIPSSFCQIWTVLFKKNSKQFTEKIHNSEWMFHIIIANLILFQIVLISKFYVLYVSLSDCWRPTDLVPWSWSWFGCAFLTDLVKKLYYLEKILGGKFWRIFWERIFSISSFLRLIRKRKRKLLCWILLLNSTQFVVLYIIVKFNELYTQFPILIGDVKHNNCLGHCLFDQSSVSDWKSAHGIGQCDWSGKQPIDYRRW